LQGAGGFWGRFTGWLSKITGEMLNISLPFLVAIKPY
jgi:hypothetical protein